MANPVQGNQPLAPQLPLDQGALFDREVSQLQTACVNKHHQKGSVVKTILDIALLVGAIWVNVVTGSIFLGAGIYLLSSFYKNVLVDGLKNTDHIDAKNALGTQSFKRYIQKNELDLSIDSIVTVYKQYKGHLAAQAGVNLAAVRV